MLFPGRASVKGICLLLLLLALGCLLAAKVGMVVPLLVGVALLASIGGLLVIPVWQVQKAFQKEPMPAKDVFAAENEARRTIAQIIGGLILIVGLLFTWNSQQADSRKATEERERARRQLMIEAYSNLRGKRWLLDRLIFLRINTDLDYYYAANAWAMENGKADSPNGEVVRSYKGRVSELKLQIGKAEEELHNNLARVGALFKPTAKLKTLIDQIGTTGELHVHDPGRLSSMEALNKWYSDFHDDFERNHRMQYYTQPIDELLNYLSLEIEASLRTD